MQFFTFGRLCTTFCLEKLYIFFIMIYGISRKIEASIETKSTFFNKIANWCTTTQNQFLSLPIFSYFTILRISMTLIHITKRKIFIYLPILLKKNAFRYMYLWQYRKVQYMIPLHIHKCLLGMQMYLLMQYRSMLFHSYYCEPFLPPFLKCVTPLLFYVKKYCKIDLKITIALFKSQEPEKNLTKSLAWLHA